MSTDRLVTVKQFILDTYPYNTDPNVRWLLAEVERLRLKLRDEMQATAALEMQDLDEFRKRREEVARARALISWIEGQVVDEAPYQEIALAIDRYYRKAAVVEGPTPEKTSNRIRWRQENQ